MNELESLIEAIKSFLDIDDEILTDEMVQRTIAHMDTQFSPTLIKQSVNEIINSLNDQGLNKQQANESKQALVDTLKEMIYGDKVYTDKKKKLVDALFDKMNMIFDQAIEKYHSFSIELPIQLEEGAQVPTYAHDSDAAADMYAMEDVAIPAHFNGMPVKTGVHIQLPEGWVAFILPRSSIGAKTPLRLSNSVGVIDSGYRGEVRALYDNISDEPYQIHKGDRIAQMLVMPSYRFKANVVDSLEDSDRGEAGFGSTGV